MVGGLLGQDESSKALKVQELHPAAWIYLLHGSTKHAVALVHGDLHRAQEAHQELLCPAFFLGWRRAEKPQRSPRRFLEPPPTTASYLGRAPWPPPPCRRREICRWSRSSCCSRGTTGPRTGPESAGGRLPPGAARPGGEERTCRREDAHVCFCSACFLRRERASVAGHL